MRRVAWFRGVPPRSLCLCVEIALSWAALTLCAVAADWPQFGGPHRNFTTDSKDLASSWPPEGPRRLWSRQMGDGYSGIVVDDGTLFTMYRKGEQEIVVALDAGTGKTLWEHAYAAPFLSSMDMKHGPGPHSTPLVAGGRVFTVGVTGKFFALDKKTGKVEWFHDLYRDFNIDQRKRGFSCSPIAYRDTVILQTGGAGNSIMAFRQTDGAVAWKKESFSNSASSPVLIHFAGQEQLVVFMAKQVAGLDPGNGDLIWTIPHRIRNGLNISMPVWGEGNLLFCSSAYDGGSRLIKLIKVAGRTVASNMWHTNQMRVHIGSILRLGDYVYGSSGDFGPAFITALNVRTGKIAWRDRSFAKANLLYANGKLIILDEDGRLALATVSPKGLKVLSQVDLLQSNCWTAPSLVGRTLYVRDRKSIVALDLGG